MEQPQVVNLSGARPPLTEAAAFEKNAAWMRAVLLPATSRADLSDADYVRLRAWLLDTPLWRCMQEVLDGGTRNLRDERDSAREFDLAINIQ